MDDENCEIKCRWFNEYLSEEESGKARYKVTGDEPVITFLNEDEVIRTDNVFKRVNRYKVKLQGDELIIKNNRQFRFVDVTFGKGYDNRGFATILFPEED